MKSPQRSSEVVGTPQGEDITEEAFSRGGYTVETQQAVIPADAGIHYIFRSLVDKTAGGRLSISLNEGGRAHYMPRMRPIKRRRAPRPKVHSLHHLPTADVRTALRVLFPPGLKETAK